jgi:Putative beta-barrel porin-2, OmpL-like. bbp2
MRVACAVAVLVLAASTANAQSPADSTPSLHVGGFVQSSFQSATSNADGVIVGRLYGRDHGDFTLDAFAAGVDRPVRAHQRDAGFTVRALVGQSARFLHAAGLDVGRDADLTQAYLMLNLPAGAGDLQLSMGKMTTMLGLEVVESVLNPNVSVGNQFIFLENFTDLGIDLNWIASSRFGVRVRVSQGWDVVKDNNDSKSVMARVGLAPDDRTTLALFGYGGPEQSRNDRDWRTGGELLVSRQVGRATANVQLDAGHEQGLDADWKGAGLWFVMPLRPDVDVALRGDWIDDADGVRTSGALGFPAHSGQRLASMTGTLNLRLWPGAQLRPEVRFDHSNLAEAFAGKPRQLVFALSAAFVY